MIFTCLLTAAAGGLVGKYSEALATELFGGAAQNLLEYVRLKATPETNHDFYKAVEAATKTAARRAFGATDNAVEKNIYKAIEKDPGRFLSTSPNALTETMQRALIVGNQKDLQSELENCLDHGCPPGMRSSLAEAKRRFPAHFAAAFGETIKSAHHDQGFKVFLTHCLQALHEVPQALNWPPEAIAAIPQIAEDLPRLAESVDKVVEQFTQVLEKLEDISHKQDRYHQETLEAVNANRAPTATNLFAFRRPSSKFTGREQQFDQLLAQHKAGNTTHITQPIAGMGGMGKSQLAREFARRCQARTPGYPEFQCIQEVGATSEAALILSLEQLIKNLGLAGQDDNIPPEHLKPLVEKALAAHQPWLLYVDSLDNPDHARPKVVINGKKQRIELLPSTTGGTILITSRRDHLPAWLNSGPPILVPVFPAEVSERILLERAVPPNREPSPEERQAAAAIAEKLRQYPLSIEQAASYCSHGLAQTTLSKYLVLLTQTEGELPPDHDFGLTDYERPVRATMRIAIKKISPEARELLSFMAWIAPSPAPADMLAGVLRASGRKLSGTDDWDALSPLVTSLRTQGLLEAVDQHQETLTLHAVSGAAWRSLLEPEQRAEDLEKWLAAMGNALPEVEAQSALGLGDWVAHGVSMLDFATGLGMKKRTQGNVGNALGLACDYLGRYGEAEPLYVRALELRREVLGESHPDTITSMNNPAFLYTITGRYDEAEPLYDRALKLRREVLGERHPHTITSMNNLALLYHVTARYGEAEPLYDRALELRREVLGERHPDTILSMNNLAGLYDATGRYGEAEPLYDRALELFREVLGERHPHTITSMNNLALLYRATGRYGEAEPLYDRALELRREVLGERHPDTITSMNNLGAFWIKRGNPKGRELLCEAYRLSRALPEQHRVRLAVESWVEDLQLDCGERE